MELKLEEQRLVHDFRRLSPGQQQQVVEYLAGLVSRLADVEGGEPTDRCAVRQEEAKPARSKEPIFTE